QDGHPEAVARDMQRIAKVCQQHGAKEVNIAHSEEEANALLTARRSALSALARLSPTTILEDATVPRSEIASMVRAIEDIAREYDVKICTFGHA
ncbi:glycolate oxidase subunit GlcD, partial [Bacillus safensis]|uniref:FAD-binding oxidoreductase n=2 Tax=Bacillaceae TaxID=186817 RepID=UPI002DDDB3BB